MNATETPETPEAAAPEPQSLAQQFGAILAKARSDSGRSLNAQARELGVAVPTLHTYEHGRANPTLDKVEDLAAQYGVQIEFRLVPKSRRK